MTHQEFRDLFQMLLAGWSTHRQRMTNEDIRGMAAIYTAGLVDLDVNLVRNAIARLIRTSKFLPTVAEIREAADVVQHGAQIAGAQAWGEVTSKMKRYGSHRTPGIDFTFDDRFTAQLVKAFGWRDLCASMNPIADRARFIEAYEQITKLEHTQARASDGIASKMLERRAEPAQIEGAVANVMGLLVYQVDADEVQ